MPPVRLPIEPTATAYHDIIAERARVHPDKTLFLSRERRLSYAEVHVETNRVAHALADAGVGRGDRVGMMTPSGIDFLLTWLGICKLGALPVPVNEAYLGLMLRNQVSDVACEVAVVADVYLERWADVAGELSALRRIYVHGTIPQGAARVPWELFPLADLLGHADASDLSVAVAPSDAMSILYTSGTTGQSKGVVYGYGQAYATARPLAILCEPDDVFYMFLPMFHTGLPHALGTVLIAGATMAVRSRFSRTQFWDDVAHFAATTTLLIATMPSFLLSNPPAPADRQNTLERVFMSPLSPRVGEFAERFGCDRIATLYNMTEASNPIMSTFERVDDRSCGRLREGVTARLVDRDDREVPVGEVGELVLRTDEPWEHNLGYWNRPDATAEAWRNQWLHTGDLLSRDAEGNYYFKDRLKDVIRRRGENVSAWELEMAVNTHPAIAESAATAVPSPHGEDEIRISVVLNGTRALDEAGLHAFLAERLPRYMVPRFIRIHDDELPKTPTGKVQKTALRTLAADGCWDSEAMSSAEAAR